MTVDHLKLKTSEIKKKPAVRQLMDGLGWIWPLPAMMIMLWLLSGCSVHKVYWEQTKSVTYDFNDAYHEHRDPEKLGGAKTQCCETNPYNAKFEETSYKRTAHTIFCPSGKKDCVHEYDPFKKKSCKSCGKDGDQKQVQDDKKHHGYSLPRDGERHLGDGGDRTIQTPLRPNPIPYGMRPPGDEPETSGYASPRDRVQW